MVTQYAESVQGGAEAFAEARAEDRAWLKEDELEWMLTYERHLAHELRDATRNLERAIARRAIRRLVAALEAR